MATACELAWAAGFLDGEGSFCLSRTPRAGSSRGRFSYLVAVSATQVNRLPLDVLRSLFGGSIYERRARARAHHAERASHSWSIHGAVEVVTAVELLAPHLLLKAEAARALAGYCRVVLAQPNRTVTQEMWEWRDRAYAELRAINLTSYG